MQLDQEIIAILYTAGEQGVDLASLTEVLQTDSAAIRQHLEQLQQQLANDNTSALSIQQYGKYYKLLTKPQYQSLVIKFLKNEQATNLSQAALEVLAIVAYRQPITRIEIDTIRGVKNSSGTIQTLQARQMIKTKGRKEAPGRPIMYATTEKFLDYFGLRSLADLPDLQEFENRIQEQPVNLDLFSEN
ncbi:SMC-Scp complex subunit ScpB [Bombilactobacillus bombi]|uniref:Segregation and condensation protein B n=1 Tax=Bombilactobacillus bombi TaxID=1303590 RepID=A0A417Z8I1_9LACO|nr:SMC-Scp complex subunit ScpB [Bombilactobacillus bombi]RHW46944.1 SMC-Scp complex subunit ScpB [Bombilactobacillus bombi]